MNRHFNHYILFIIVLIILYLLGGGELIGPSIAHPQVPDMNMNATPNPVGSGARAMGMGGAFISVADDATAASWNPGGLLQLTKPEISIVGSFFSGNMDYKTSGINGDIEDTSPHIYHLNYLSAVIPFLLFRRNFVFSINYQHLYEFSQDHSYIYWDYRPEILIDSCHKDYKYQRGSLNTISPALAIQVTPSVYLGLTFNFWDNGILDNGWENINIQDEEGFEFEEEMIMHSEIYEKYDFSGFNMHIGFLFKSDYHTIWGKKRKFRLGGILKTPFDADISHEKREIQYGIYPESPSKNWYKAPISPPQNLTLKMPISYGLGMSLDFTDSFTLALDVYRTHWDQYILKYPSGAEWSPINIKQKEKANIKPTTQIRLGAEYLFQKPGRIIPIRIGTFYDPEPSSDRPDDIYGISLGSGISYKEIFSFDFVYQFRFGDKKEAESMQGVNISSKVVQHYFHASIIYYLF